MVNSPDRRSSSSDRSGSSGTLPLGSSPRISSPDRSGRSSPEIISVYDVTDPDPTVVPPISYEEVDQALETLSAFRDQVALQETLRSDFRTLAQMYTNEIARGDRLRSQIATFHTSAAPFLDRVQRQYVEMRDRLAEYAQKLSDYRDELARRHDQTSVLSSMRAQLEAIAADRASLRTRLRQSERDRAALIGQAITLSAALTKAQDDVAEGLASISDLLQQVDDRASLEARLHAVQDENTSLQTQLQTHHAVCDQLIQAEQERDRAIRDLRSLQTNIAYAVQLSGTPKRSRSSDGSPPRNTRQRLSVSSTTDPAIAGSTSPLVGSPRPRSPPVPSPTSPSGSGVESSSHAGSSDSDDLDEVMLAALSRSRSAARHQPPPKSPSPPTLVASSTFPDQPAPRYLQYSPPPSSVIEIGGDADEIGDDDGAIRSGSTGSANPGDGGDDSLGDSGSDSHNGQSSSRSSSDSVISIGPRPSIRLNDLLTPAAFAALPPLMVPRTSWIPSYFARLRRARSEIVPWSPTRISYVSVGSLDLNTLFHHYSKPKNFIFPPNPHTRTPRSGSWASSLINRSQVESLYNLAPWDSVVVPTFPLSFRLTGWYEGMGRLYLDIESTHRQAF